MKLLAKSLSLLKEVEGFSATAYMDANDGWTIGWGRMENVRQGDITTREDEDIWLRRYIIRLEQQLDKLITVPLSAQQHDALVIFAYNIGVGQFQKSSLLKHLNKAEYAAVPAQLARWIYDDGKVSPGLMIRRAREVRLWQSGRT
jgi:lysozyme